MTQQQAEEVMSLTGSEVTCVSVTQQKQSRQLADVWSQAECMMGVKMLLLVSLLALLEVMMAAPRGRRGDSMPGAPSDISSSDVFLPQAVLSAAGSFNNQSNDAFLFRPSAILRAQRQIIKGLRYIVDLDISRTVCRKRDHVQDLSRCDFQPEGRLHQTFECHTEVWMIPWENRTRTEEFHCRPQHLRQLQLDK